MKSRKKKTDELFGVDHHDLMMKEMKNAQKLKETRDMMIHDELKRMNEFNAHPPVVRTRSETVGNWCIVAIAVGLSLGIVGLFLYKMGGF